MIETGDKLLEIISKCKCGVHLGVNVHKDYYESVGDRMESLTGGDLDEVPINVLREMAKRDTIVELQFYPNTPVGSYSLYHYDLNVVLDEALAVLNSQEPTHD